MYLRGVLGGLLLFVSAESLGFLLGSQVYLVWNGLVKSGLNSWPRNESAFPSSWAVWFQSLVLFSLLSLPLSYVKSSKCGLWHKMIYPAWKVDILLIYKSPWESLKFTSSFDFVWRYDLWLGMVKKVREYWKEEYVPMLLNYLSVHTQHSLENFLEFW